MNKRISATIVALSLTVTAIAGNSLFATKAFAKNQNNISGATIENAIKAVSQNSIYKTFKKVTATPRKLGTGQEKQAAAYISSELQKMGYPVSLQKFNYKNREIVGDDLFDFKKFFAYSNVKDAEKSGTGVNVIATKQSKVKNAPVIVVSAHYDTEEGSVGAVDNASGVSTVLEIARVIKNCQYPFDIKFVLFSGEEEGLFGSKAYVAKMDISQKKRIKGDINIDCVGLKGVTEYQVLSSSNEQLEIKTGKPQSCTNIITGLFTKKHSLKVISLPMSDHHSFFMAGIPSATLTQKVSAIMPKINTVKDVDNNVDPQRMVQATKLVVEALEGLKQTKF
jgi:Zn-dependent M28 family amino/carboxypeptidase